MKARSGNTSRRMLSEVMIFLGGHSHGPLNTAPWRPELQVPCGTLVPPPVPEGVAHVDGDLPQEAREPVATVVAAVLQRHGACRGLEQPALRFGLRLSLRLSERRQ